MVADNADNPTTPTPAHTDKPPIRAIRTNPPCPQCGNPANSETVRTQLGTLVGNYCCPQHHIWITKWAHVS